MSTPQVVTSLRSIPHRSVQAQQIEERFRAMDEGSVVSYHEINALIHGNVQGRDRCYAATARHRLLYDGILIVAVINVGFQRATDSTKLRAMQAKRQGAHNKVKGALKIGRGVDHAKLTPIESQSVTMEMCLAGAMANMSSVKGAKVFASAEHHGSLPDGVTVPQV